MTNECGPYARRLQDEPLLAEEGIFRPDGLKAIARGEVDSVSVARSALGNIDSVELLVAGAPVTLVAAEVYEEEWRGASGSC